MAVGIKTRAKAVVHKSKDKRLKIEIKAYVKAMTNQRYHFL